MKNRTSDSFFVNTTTLQDLSAEITSQVTYPFTGEPLWIAFFRTLTADRTVLSPRIYEEYRTKFFDRFKGWQLDSHNVPPDSPREAWLEISRGIGDIIEDKEMFLTTRGYLGLSQEGFVEGDVVCVLCGGEVPFMVRPLGDRLSHHEKFELLSECYVHGVMDGEAMQDIHSQRLKPFRIV